MPINATFDAFEGLLKSNLTRPNCAFVNQPLLEERKDSSHQMCKLMSPGVHLGRFFFFFASFHCPTQCDSRCKPLDPRFQHRRLSAMTSRRWLGNGLGLVSVKLAEGVAP